MSEGKRNYERERARREMEREIQKARRFAEDHQSLTMMTFIGCMVSGKAPEEVLRAYEESKAAAGKHLSLQSHTEGTSK